MNILRYWDSLETIHAPFQNNWNQWKSNIHPVQETTMIPAGGFGTFLFSLTFLWGFLSNFFIIHVLFFIRKCKFRLSLKVSYQIPKISLDHFLFLSIFLPSNFLNFFNWKDHLPIQALTLYLRMTLMGLKSLNCNK